MRSRKSEYIGRVFTVVRHLVQITSRDKMVNQSESLHKHGCCDTQVHVIAQGEKRENTGYPQSNDLRPCAEW